MDDLKARLRREVPYQGKSRLAFLCHEAADRIEQLEAQIALVLVAAAKINVYT